MIVNLERLIISNKNKCYQSAFYQPYFNQFVTDDQYQKMLKLVKTGEIRNLKIIENDN